MYLNIKNEKTSIEKQIAPQIANYYMVGLFR